MNGMSTRVGLPDREYDLQRLKIHSAEPKTTVLAVENILEVIKNSNIASDRCFVARYRS